MTKSALHEYVDDCQSRFTPPTEHDDGNSLVMKQAADMGSPGSPEAVSAGCTCPRIDNGHGRGYMGQSGIFVITEGCPLHWAAITKAGAKMTSTRDELSGVRLTKAQDAVMRECANTENRLGRIGWPLSDWEAVAKPVCQPLIDAGLLEFRRLGGYPGVRITDAGRRAIQEATK